MKVRVVGLTGDQINKQDPVCDVDFCSSPGEMTGSLGRKLSRGLKAQCVSSSST